MSGNGVINDNSAPRMVSLTEAMAASGRSRASLRALIRRGRLRAMRANDGKVLVPLEPWLAQGARAPERAPVRTGNRSPAQDQGEHSGGERTPSAHLHEQLSAALQAQARAEGERDAMKGTITTLETALADLAARLDRAEARLALPWWRRLVGA